MLCRNLIASVLCFLFVKYGCCYTADIHLFGTGIEHPELTFASQYFVVLHPQPIYKVELQTTCRLWTQVFNETQFCLRLLSNVNLSSMTLSDVLDQARFCSFFENESDENGRFIDYRVTIVRYKVYDEFCDKGFRVQILDEDKKIVYSKKVDTILRSDLCPCPLKDWSQRLQCTDSKSNRALLSQISNDLKPFESDRINFDKVLRTVEDEFGTSPRTYAICLYQIINNKLYRKCYGEYVGFNKFFDETILSILRKYKLTNTEFIVNLGDWPLALKKNPKLKQLPILSWCGSDETFDIVLPTYELTESVLHSQGKIVTDILSVFGRQPLPYQLKSDKLFWRGRDSHRSRLNLITLSSQSPDPSKYNVSITNFFFFRNEMSKYSDPEQSPKERYVPFQDFFHHKYQLNIDGSVAAYRFPFLLAGNSLVIKQNSSYYEFFYKLLKSNHHYIPVDYDLNELDEIVTNLIKERDSIRTERIIWNARKFVLQHLLAENVLCYYANVIELYSQLLTQPNIQLRNGCERIDSKNSTQHYDNIDISKCNCQQTNETQQ